MCDQGQDITMLIRQIQLFMNYTRKNYIEKNKHYSHRLAREYKRFYKKVQTGKIYSVPYENTTIFAFIYSYIYHSLLSG